MSKAPATNQSSPASADAPGAGLPPQSYEAAMQELAELVQRLESGEQPLDQLLAGYQRGTALLQYCRDRLQAVEDQVKVLDDGMLKVWKAP